MCWMQSTLSSSIKVSALRFLFVTALVIHSLVACGCVPGMSTKERKRFAKQHPDALHSLETAEGPIEFIKMGRGQAATLVFVHGSPGGWHAFAHFLKEKELQNSFSMVAVDRPGYGGSEPGEPERSLERQATRVAAVVKNIDQGYPIILVGHSYGGPVVARMAIDNPDLVDGLVLVAASLDPALEKTKWFQHPANWQWLRWLIPDSLDVCNQEILALKNELLALGNAWNRISQHTAIVHGEKDTLVPYENVAFIQKQFRQADIRLFVDAKLNHFVPWKRPDLIKDAIRWTLQELSTAAGNIKPSSLNQ